MAVRGVEMLGIGREVVAGLDGAGVRGVDSVVGCAKPQRVAVSFKAETRRWSPAAGVVLVRPTRLRRISATSGDRQPSKDYDVNEVIEKVVHEEENELPEEEKKTPEPLSEGEPSPFSPAIETDDTETFQGKGVSKDSLVQPPRGLHEGAASASIGEGLGASEESALSADIGGSVKSGPGSHTGRDWRVQSSSSSSSENGAKVKPRVEKADQVQPAKHKHMFGPSEASCDVGSWFKVGAGVLESDGGKSVDDYKLRADTFSTRADLYSDLKSRESKSAA